MRSVVVVLPASMCAMIPFFLPRRSGVFLATDTAISPSLPSVMCECPVRLGHPVRVFPALYARANVILGIQDLTGQPATHRLLPARAGEADHPSEGQRVSPAWVHLDRHLIGSATDPAALYLQTRPDVLQSVVKDRDRIGAGPLLDKGEGVVNYLLGGALLAVEHHLVYELLHQHAPVDGICRYPPLRRRRTPRHLLPLSYFFVPYFDRLCLRLETPRVSRAPRTTL